MFKASWRPSSFTPGLNNTAGSCLPIFSFLAPSALILLQTSMSECSITQRKCWLYTVPTTSFKTGMLHSLHAFVWSYSCHSLSSYLCPVAFLWFRSCTFLPFFFLTWCGCPAEDDLSGQSYYPFGRVGIITIEWRTHLHAHRHGNMNAWTENMTPPPPCLDIHTHIHEREEVKESLIQHIEGEGGGFQMNRHQKQLDATCTDLYPDLYQNA